MEPPHSRPLGPAESVLWKLDAVCPVNAVVFAKIRGTFTETRLRDGLNQVQKRHPLLRMKVEQSGSGYRFSDTGVPPVPLLWIHGGEAQVYDIAQAELRTPVRPPEGPLIRCVCVQHDSTAVTVILAANHAVLDGLSSFYLVQDLCEAMADGKTTASETFPGPLEQYLPARCRGFRGWLRYSRYFTGMLWTFATGSRPERLNAGKAMCFPAGSPAPRSPSFIERRFSLDFTAALLEQAKREGTTLHGVLSAALLRAVSREFALPPARPVCLGSLTNIRKDLFQPSQTGIHATFGKIIGLYVSSLPTLHRVDLHGSFWNLAREIRETVRTGRDRMDDLVLVPLSNRLLNRLGSGKDPEAFAALTERLNFGTLGITNLGSLDGYEKTWKEISLESYSAVVSPSVLNPLLVAAFTFRQRLTLNFIHMEPVITRAEADRVADQMVRELETVT